MFVPTTRSSTRHSWLGLTPQAERRRRPALVRPALLIALTFASIGMTSSQPTCSFGGQAELEASFKLDWPALRARYLELYWKETDRTEDEEVKAIGNRLKEIAGEEFQVPEWLADDAVALAALAARAYRSSRDNPALADKAEQLARRAIERGNPRGIGSYRLASILVHRTRPPAPSQPLAPDAHERLDEAERQLTATAQVEPDARTKPLLGRITMLRGRRDEGLGLMRAAMNEAPRSKSAAWEYASAILQDAEFVGPYVPEIEPIQARFPDEPYLRVFLALALFRDLRFAEAAEWLTPVRDDAVEILGVDSVDGIVRFGDMPAEVADGLRALERNELPEAERLFRSAVAKKPRNVEPARLLSRVLWKRVSEQPGGMDINGAATIGFDIAVFAERFPDDAELVTLYVVILAYQNEFQRAEGLLDRLDQRKINYGKFLDPATVTAIRKQAAGERAMHMRNPRPFEWPDLQGWDLRLLMACGVWFGWIAFMALAGVLLTRMSRPRPEELSPGQVGPTRRESWLNWLYLLLLTIALFMFYIAVPFVVLGLLTVTLGLFFALFVARLLVIDVLIRGSYAAWGVLRSAFAGPAEDITGVLVDAGQQPDLFRVLQEVAARCEVPMPERVYLTPDTMIGVSESRAGLFGLVGRRTRSLSLGLAALPSVGVEEFKSILAHEFAHFSHQDTYYGRFLYQVTRSLSLSLAHMSAAAGFFNYFNPFYWVFWLYLRAYGLLSAGFMRTREYQADRMAARLYGRSVFSAALTRIVIETPLFEKSLPSQIVYAASQGRFFENVYDDYRTIRRTPELTEFRSRAFHREIDQKANWFDFHPSLSERLAAIAQFPESNVAADETPAAELVAQRTEIERTLTQLYTRRLVFDTLGIVLA